MILKVENLGPIESGEIDFNKNLIVLTGPNNTGKSYLTYLVHAIHNSNRLVESYKNIREQVATIFKDTTPVSKAMKSGGFDVNYLVSEYNDGVNELLDNIIKSNLVKIFASNIISPIVNIKVNSFNLSEIDDAEIVGLRIKDNKSYIRWADGTTEEEPTKGKATVTDTKLFAAIILGTFIAKNPIFGKSYVFPSERTSINLFARDIISKKAGSRDDIAVRVLAGEDIEQIASSIKSAQNSNPKYPLAINDYINFVNDFIGNKPYGELSFLSNILEESILGGNISISEFNQILFTPNGLSQTYGLHESSSSVKSLSYLAIYLRYFAKKGDWIIIDEPEINLHPNLQVAIAKAFAQMINSGLKLIISTHSDYLVKELNNLVLLHDLNSSENGRNFVASKGYIDTQLIDKNQIGAYYLHDNKITYIDVAETGIEVPSINDTINAIDSLTEEILFQ